MKAAECKSDFEITKDTSKDNSQTAGGFCESCNGTTLFMTWYGSGHEAAAVLLPGFAIIW